MVLANDDWKLLAKLWSDHEDSVKKYPENDIRTEKHGSNWIKLDVRMKAKHF